MKKIVLFIAIGLLLSMGDATAQNERFIVHRIGYLTSEKGEMYTIREMKGMTAHDIFTLIQTNVGKVYNSPKEVMTCVEDKQVTIMAMSSGLVPFNTKGDFFYCYYKLEFEIKDGKVKVSIPLIDDDIWRNSMYHRSFIGLCRKMFDKDGNAIQGKYGEMRRILEEKVNKLIDSLLEVKAEEDW